MELLENGEDPYNSKSTDSQYSKHRRKRGMTGSAEKSSRNFIQTADRLEKKNTHDPHASYLDNLQVRGE